MRTANTAGATGWCLEVHDLAVSKLVAGREKDVEFVRGLTRHGLVDRALIAARSIQTPLDTARRSIAEARLNRLD